MGTSASQDLTSIQNPIHQLDCSVRISFSTHGHTGAKSCQELDGFSAIFPGKLKIRDALDRLSHHFSAYYPMQNGFTLFISSPDVDVSPFAMAASGLVRCNPVEFSTFTEFVVGSVAGVAPCHFSSNMSEQPRDVLLCPTLTIITQRGALIAQLHSGYVVDNPVSVSHIESSIISSSDSFNLMVSTNSPTNILHRATTDNTSESSPEDAEATAADDDSIRSVKKRFCSDEVMASGWLTKWPMKSQFYGSRTKRFFALLASDDASSPCAVLAYWTEPPAAIPYESYIGDPDSAPTYYNDQAIIDISTARGKFIVTRDCKVKRRSSYGEEYIKLTSAADTLYVSCNDRDDDILWMTKLKEVLNRQSTSAILVFPDRKFLLGSSKGDNRATISAFRDSTISVTEPPINSSEGNGLTRPHSFDDTIRSLCVWKDHINMHSRRLAVSSVLTSFRGKNSGGVGSSSSPSLAAGQEDELAISRKKIKKPNGAIAVICVSNDRSMATNMAGPSNKKHVDLNSCSVVRDEFKWSRPVPITSKSTRSVSKKQSDRGASDEGTSSASDLTPSAQASADDLAVSSSSPAFSTGFIRSGHVVMGTQISSAFTDDKNSNDVSLDSRLELDESSAIVSLALMDKEEPPPPPVSTSYSVLGSGMKSVLGLVAIDSNSLGGASSPAVLLAEARESLGENTTTTAAPGRSVIMPTQYIQMTNEVNVSYKIAVVSKKVRNIC